VATAHIAVLFVALVTLLGARRVFAARRSGDGGQGKSGVPAGHLDGTDVPVGCHGECGVPVGRLDEPAVRRAWSQRCRQEAEALRDLDRALRSTDPALVEPHPPPIEQLAFDLRRLGRQRRAGPTRESHRWLAEVQRAYDLRLRLACRYLGVTEHLEGLVGIDRDIERIRIEHQLEAAGLALRS
jgi:hypothetical protein